MDSSKSTASRNRGCFFENRISSKHVITTHKDIVQSIKVFQFDGNVI